MSAPSETGVLQALIIKKYIQADGFTLTRGLQNMARGRFEFLSRDEILHIHEASLRILEEVGIVVHSASTEELLKRRGLTTLKDGRRIVITESQVKEAIKKAPKSFVLASRDRKNDLKLPSEERMLVCNGGEGVYVRDLVAGEARPSRTEDVRDFGRLVDALDAVDFFWPMVGALDQPERLKGIAEMRASFESTTKHVQAGALDETEADAFVDMASILAGDEDELRKRPIFSCVQCPISPLTFDAGLTEAQVVLARRGIPVVGMVASVVGLTSPVTLSGSIAQINAENLASCVISQAAAEGAPWIYSSDSSPGDLKSGSIDYGAIESTLIRTAMAQMGRHYGFPTMTGAVGLEATGELLGRPMDGVAHMAVMGLVPSDLASGFGSLDQAAGASFEQLVLDAWVWDAAREFSRAFPSDDSAISIETIKAAALDGNFLGKRHTLARFRTELAASRKPEAVLFGRSDTPPRGELLKQAQKEVRRILGEPFVARVSKSEAAEMDRLIKKLAG